MKAFEIMLLVFKSLGGLLPEYVSDYPSITVPPARNKTYGEAGLVSLVNLPEDLRASDVCFNSFK